MGQRVVVSKGVLYGLSERARALGIEFNPPREGDAGYDLYAEESVTLFVRAGAPAIVPTGLHIEIPSGYVGFIKDRSSMGARGLHVFGGVIDANYRGLVKVLLYNFSNSPVRIEAKQKIAQLIIVPALTLPTVQVPPESLSETVRGANGFGSTGT